MTVRHLPLTRAAQAMDPVPATSLFSLCQHQLLLAEGHVTVSLCHGHIQSLAVLIFRIMSEHIGRP